MARGAMHRLDEAAARDRQSRLLLEEGGDLAVRQAELCVENDGERDGLRTQLCGRRAERIRRLERMPALDATPAPATPSDANPKRTDHDPWDRQRFLVLHRHTGLDDAIAAAGTARREPRVMGLLDVRGYASARRPTIRVSGLPPRALRMPVQRLGKGRRLSIARPAGRIELSLQMVDLLTQALVLSAQDFSLALRTLRAFAEHLRVLRWAVLVSRNSRLRHASLMPESPLQYKRR